MGVAVISGNLPLLAPVFERFLGRNASARRYYYYGSSGRNGYGVSSNYRHGGSAIRGPADNLTNSASMPHSSDRLSDTDQPVPPELGDMELDDRAILVKTQVEVGFRSHRL